MRRQWLFGVSFMLSVLVPAFRARDIEEGIVRGVAFIDDAIP